jgi:hypothetical protein
MWPTLIPVVAMGPNAAAALAPSAAADVFLPAVRPAEAPPPLRGYVDILSFGTIARAGFLLVLTRRRELAELDLLV